MKIPLGYTIEERRTELLKRAKTVFVLRLNALEKQLRSVGARATSLASIASQEADLERKVAETEDWLEDLEQTELLELLEGAATKGANITNQRRPQ